MKNTLNSKIWGKDDELRPEVKNHIEEIVAEFVDNVEIPMEIADIQLVGSNASFNYNEHSDLDVHIIVNFDLMKIPKYVLVAYYNLEKSKFNDKYDISIHGVPVEIYVDDINSNVMSNGIYSLYGEAQLKKPTPIEEEAPDITDEYDESLAHVKEVLSKGNSDDLKELLNNVYMMRRNSLSTDGEFGKGNLIFKRFRNEGILDKIREKLAEEISKDLTLESLSLGEIVARWDF